MHSTQQIHTVKHHTTIANMSLKKIGRMLRKFQVASRKATDEYFANLNKKRRTLARKRSRLRKERENAGMVASIYLNRRDSRSEEDDCVDSQLEPLDYELTPEDDMFGKDHDDEPIYGQPYRFFYNFGNR